MVKLNVLGELRTKEELINYLKQLGKEMTEEEINALKQSYNKAQENDDALSMQQLSEVAGGIRLTHYTEAKIKNEIAELNNELNNWSLKRLDRDIYFSMFSEEERNYGKTLLDLSEGKGFMLVVDDKSEYIDFHINDGGPEKELLVNLKFNISEKEEFKIPFHVPEPTQPNFKLAKEKEYSEFLVKKIVEEHWEEIINKLLNEEHISENQLEITNEATVKEMRTRFFEPINMDHLTKSGLTKEDWQGALSLYGLSLADESNSDVNLMSTEVKGLKELAELVGITDESAVIHPSPLEQTVSSTVKLTYKQTSTDIVAAVTTSIDPAMPNMLVEPIQQEVDKDRKPVPQVDTVEGQQIPGMDSPRAQQEQPVASEQRHPGNTFIPTEGGTVMPGEPMDFGIMKTKVEKLDPTGDQTEQAVTLTMPKAQKGQSSEESISASDSETDSLSTSDYDSDTAPLMPTDSTFSSKLNCRKVICTSAAIAGYLAVIGVLATLAGVYEGDKIKKFLKEFSKN